MHPSPKAVVTRWFVRLWRDRDATIIAETRDARSRSGGLGPQGIEGVDAFRAFYDLASNVLRETDVRFDHIMEDGDRVAASLVFAGKVHDRPFSVRVAAFGRVVDGVLVEGENLVDVAGLMSQIGRGGPATITDALHALQGPAAATGAV
jgi:ketosteroid isomerase-like protein